MSMVSCNLAGARPPQMFGKTWPRWVPTSVMAYLAHTEEGVSIRALSRASQVHPSTISRQISRWERLRDEPLIDEALSRLGPRRPSTKVRTPSKETATMQAMTPDAPTLVDDVTFQTEARRVLRRLSEPRAVLALAGEMEKGVVVRETESGTTLRTAVVDRAVAQALAVKDWIVCAAEGRITRYRITAAGRTALGELIAQAENRAQGFADGAAVFDMSGAPAGERKKGMGETPLMILGRRREKSGEMFLAPHLVRAGERLREDFELAQMVEGATPDWDAVIAGAAVPLNETASLLSAEAAQARVFAALGELGHGLGDVALRCCCLLEGLESAERALGWSARSGKIVLRIALTRLHQHYASQGEENKMIG